MDHGPWTMIQGPWSMDHGPWPMVRGPWSMDHGPWTMVQGPWSMDHGPGTMVHGPWSMDHGQLWPGHADCERLLRNEGPQPGPLVDHGPWTVVHGPWSMDHGPWTMVHGPWSMYRTVDIWVCSGRVWGSLGGPGRALGFLDKEKSRKRVRLLVNTFFTIGP